MKGTLLLEIGPFSVTKAELFSLNIFFSIIKEKIKTPIKRTVLINSLLRFLFEISGLGEFHFVSHSPLSIHF